jgi:hypothetical protein
LSGWQELPHPRAERGLTAAAACGARSSLSGRADALYVVNDALGSFLLRANEVIDQVPMSACGTDRPIRSRMTQFGNRGHESCYSVTAQVSGPSQWLVRAAKMPSPELEVGHAAP